MQQQKTQPHQTTRNISTQPRTKNSYPTVKKTKDNKQTTRVATCHECRTTTTTTSFFRRSCEHHCISECCGFHFSRIGMQPSQGLMPLKVPTSDTEWGQIPPVRFWNKGWVWRVSFLSHSSPLTQPIYLQVNLGKLSS